MNVLNEVTFKCNECEKPIAYKDMIAHLKTCVRIYCDCGEDFTEVELFTQHLNLDCNKIRVKCKDCWAEMQRAD